MKYPIVLHRTDLDLSAVRKLSCFVLPSRSEVIYSDTIKAAQSFHEAIGKCVHLTVLKGHYLHGMA